MRMNPILFSVEDNFPMTQAGIHNLKNVGEEFVPSSASPTSRCRRPLMREIL